MTLSHDGPNMFDGSVLAPASANSCCSPLWESAPSLQVSSGRRLLRVSHGFASETHPHAAQNGLPGCGGPPSGTGPLMASETARLLGIPIAEFGYPRLVFWFHPLSPQLYFGSLPLSHHLSSTASHAPATLLGHPGCLPGPQGFVLHSIARFHRP